MTLSAEIPLGAGVVYLAIGEECGRLAMQSLSFLRQTGYTGPVRIVSDGDLPDEDGLHFELIRVFPVDRTWDSRFYKTQLNRFGFPVTLYLDADTLPIASIDTIWDELRWGDLCAAHDLQSDVGSFLDVSWEKTSISQDELRYMNSSSLRQLSYFNSGVMLWRQTPAIDRMFQVWHGEWQRFRVLDQLALVRALARTTPPVHTLSTIWNCPADKVKSIVSAQNAGVRILHFLSRQRMLLPRYVREYSFSKSLVAPPGYSSGNPAEDATKQSPRLRVLWIAGTFFPRIGGLEQFIEKTIEGLSDHCEVALVTKGGQWYPGKKPVSHFPLQKPHASTEAEAWRQMADSLQEVIARFDPHIVHFGSAQSASCRSLIPEGIVTVATVHGNDLTNLRPARSEEDTTSYIVESLNECDFIFAVSDHTASLVRRWGVSVPLGVFTPGCDLDFYHPSPAVGKVARRSLRLSSKMPVILTVGRLVPRKGHLNVLNAIERLPFRVHWIVVGDGPCRDELTTAITERGMQNQVTMTGGVSDEQLLGFYNACDTFVLTPEEHRIDSWLDSEGFGLVLHEAGACGKPVITSALAGCRDAVIDGGTGILVPPSDPAQLSEVLELVLTQPGLAKTLGKAGLALVRCSGGWARFARQVYYKYEEILIGDASDPSPPDYFDVLSAEHDLASVGNAMDSSSWRS